MGVRYSYLPEQFSDCEELWAELKKFVSTGDFTLGEPLSRFEEDFAKLIGCRYAVGVNSGTDAIKLSLKACGVKAGDEVITAANTFVATVGAIVELGAVPIFVDCDDTFCMNTAEIEGRITERTRAIVPVHFTGYMTDMRRVMSIADRHNLIVVEDACQSILGAIEGRNAGTWGATGTFSLHPLKNLNVWSDGGVIVTNDVLLEKKLRLLRNHGLEDRDTVVVMGCNSRLDTFQAVVGNWLLPQTKQIADKRIENARVLDSGFEQIKEIRVPDRPADYRIVYHLYMVFAERRDELLDYCLSKNIEAKIHYPTPIYRQPALEYLENQAGDFPMADRHAETVISFPCDQHLKSHQLEFIIQTVREFYGYRS